MAARKTLQLEDDSRAQLQRIVKRASDWRERERAQTLLLLDSGVFAQEVARQIADGPKVHVNTMAATLKASGLVWKRTCHSLKKAEAKTLSAKQP